LAKGGYSSFISHKSDLGSINDKQPLLQATSTPTPSPEPLSFSLIVGGDLMFDRHIRSKAEAMGNYDFLFDPQLTDFLNSADFALANLEGPITLERSVSQNSLPGGPGNYTFTFSPEIVPVLKNNNLTLLNLGNNHILNFGIEGLNSTYQYLDDAQLIYFGDVGGEEAKQRYYLLELFQQKIALISYNQFVEGAKNKTLVDIAAAKDREAGLILLFSHWGNEYVPQANQAIVDLAHEFIDQGVDLIVGGHPHVIQNKEIYHGKSIYYSLGNFVFDQYFSDETQEGLLLKINFTFSPAFSNWRYQIEEQKVKMGRDGITRLDETMIE
jgi:poly-gamma-glutamate synthesis protein (capsule biosynthesis protein)